MSIKPLARLAAVAATVAAGIVITAQAAAYDIESHWWLLGLLLPVASVVTAWLASINTATYSNQGEPKAVALYGAASVVTAVTGALWLRHLITDNASMALARIWSEQHYPDQPQGAQDLSQAHLTMNLTVHLGHLGFWVMLVAAAAMLVVTANGIAALWRQRQRRRMQQQAVAAG